MSLEQNSNLMERAHNLVEELTSHPAKLDVALQAAIDSGDLEQIEYWVKVCESTLSQQHFYENSLIDGTDER